MAANIKERPGGVAEAGGGGLGIKERPFNRIYHNWAGLPMADAQIFIDAFNGMQTSNGIGPRDRHVLRALMTPDAMHGLVEQSGELPGRVEFALPVTVLGKEMFFVGAGANGHERRSRPPKVIKDEVNTVYQRPPRTLEQHIQRVFDSKHSIITSIETPEQIDTLAELWGKTFGGWNKDSVMQLAMDLSKQADPDFPQDKRDVFFTGIVDSNNNLVAATLAGKIDFQTGDKDKPFSVWETTEWLAHPDNETTGLVAASAAFTNAQIINGYEGRGNYTIIAECNTSTPAPGAAQRAGMVMPDVWSGDHNHHQILEQNVGVGDGKEHGIWMAHSEEGPVLPLRDFGVFQLRPVEIQDLYLPSMN